jgi:hypothetical protein
VLAWHHGQLDIRIKSLQKDFRQEEVEQDTRPVAVRQRLVEGSLVTF